MSDAEWLCRKLDGWRADDAPDDAFVVELENTLAAYTFGSDSEIKEEAKALHESLRRGCFALDELRQFFHGQRIDSQNLRRRLDEHSLKVADSPARAFIAQPFRDVPDGNYERIVEPSCCWELVHPIRIDKRERESNLMEKIQAGFDEANLFIADLTENNQNVFYEIGYLEARGIEGVFLCSAPLEQLFYTRLKDIILVRGGESGTVSARRELRAALRKKRSALNRLT